MLCLSGERAEKVTRQVACQAAGACHTIITLSKQTFRKKRSMTNPRQGGRTATKARGHHRCKYCGKDLPTPTGLKLHIANSTGCRKQWERLEQDALRQESPSPNLPATSNSITPQYDDFTMPDLLDPESLAFPPSEMGRLRRPASPHSPDQTTPESPSKRARVEEANDGCHRWAQEFDGAAVQLGEGTTVFEEIQERQEALHESPMTPFANKDDWDLAKWLMKNTTRTATDEFLKMEGVCHN